MKSPIRYFLVLSSVAVTTACSFTDPYLRSEPPFYLSEQVSDSKKLLPLRCVGMDGQFERSSVATAAEPNRCLYFAVEVGKFVADETLGMGGTPGPHALHDRRNLMVHELLNISDQNCATFLNRAFANKSGLDLGKNIFREIATGLSAGTAHGSPDVSAALSGINLIVGAGVSEADKAFYLDKSFQAMHAAVMAQRAEIKARIVTAMNRAGYSQYPLPSALSDIREYSDSCSIRAGLQQLSKLAEAEKATQEKALNAANAGSPSARVTLESALAQADPQRVVQLSAALPVLRIGRDGQALNLQSDRPGHLLLIQAGTDERLSLLFPNGLDANVTVGRGSLQLPRANWALSAAGPPGEGGVLAVVTDAPFNAAVVRAALAQGRLPDFGRYGAALTTWREVADEGGKARY